MTKQTYSFTALTNTDKLASLKQECLKHLTSPPDGMWEVFRAQATNWGIVQQGEIIGYAAIDADQQLIQFYISPRHLEQGKMAFKALLDSKNIKTAIVGTNNPTYLSLALHFVEKLHIHTHLFRDNYEVKIEEKEGDFKKCQKENLEKIVNFCHYSVGAPKAWLLGYIGTLIEKGEVFFLEQNDTIIGTAEVRKSTSTPEVADIGMIVSPDYRRKGYGTFLLHKAKTIALDWGKTPICSCEKDNIGSTKSIHNAGFVSTYQLLALNFK